MEHTNKSSSSFHSSLGYQEFLKKSDETMEETNY
jgi:hypothetical protein